MSKTDSKDDNCLHSLSRTSKYQNFKKSHDIKKTPNSSWSDTDDDTSSSYEYVWEEAKPAKQYCQPIVREVQVGKITLPGVKRGLCTLVPLKAVFVILFPNNTPEDLQTGFKKLKIYTLTELEALRLTEYVRGFYEDGLRTFTVGCHIYVSGFKDGEACCNIWSLREKYEDILDAVLNQTNANKTSGTDQNSIEMDVCKPMPTSIQNTKKNNINSKTKKKYYSSSSSTSSSSSSSTSTSSSSSSEDSTDSNYKNKTSKVSSRSNLTHKSNQRKVFVQLKHLMLDEEEESNDSNIDTKVSETNIKSLPGIPTKKNCLTKNKADKGEDESTLEVQKSSCNEIRCTISDASEKNGFAIANKNKIHEAELKQPSIDNVLKKSPKIQRHNSSEQIITKIDKTRSSVVRGSELPQSDAVLSFEEIFEENHSASSNFLPRSLYMRKIDKPNHIITELITHSEKKNDSSKSSVTINSGTNKNLKNTLGSTPITTNFFRFLADKPASKPVKVSDSSATHATKSDDEKRDTVLELNQERGENTTEYKVISAVSANSSDEDNISKVEANSVFIHIGSTSGNIPKSKNERSPITNKSEKSYQRTKAAKIQITEDSGSTFRNKNVESSTGSQTVGSNHRSPQSVDRSRSTSSSDSRRHFKNIPARIDLKRNELHEKMKARYRKPPSAKRRNYTFRFRPDMYSSSSDADFGDEEDDTVYQKTKNKVLRSRSSRDGSTLFTRNTRSYYGSRNSPTRYNGAYDYESRKKTRERREKSPYLDRRMKSTSPMSQSKSEKVDKDGYKRHRPRNGEYGGRTRHSCTTDPVVETGNLNNEIDNLIVGIRKRCDVIPHRKTNSQNGDSPQQNRVRPDTHRRRRSHSPSVSRSFSPLHRSGKYRRGRRYSISPIRNNSTLWRRHYNHHNRRHFSDRLNISRGTEIRKFKSSTSFSSREYQSQNNTAYRKAIPNHAYKAGSECADVHNLEQHYSSTYNNRSTGCVDSITHESDTWSGMRHIQRSSHTLPVVRRVDYFERSLVESQFCSYDQQLGLEKELEHESFLTKQKDANAISNEENQVIIIKDVRTLKEDSTEEQWPFFASFPFHESNVEENCDEDVDNSLVLDRFTSLRRKKNPILMDPKPSHDKEICSTSRSNNANMPVEFPFNLTPTIQECGDSTTGIPFGLNQPLPEHDSHAMNFESTLVTAKPTSELVTKSIVCYENNQLSEMKEHESNSNSFETHTEDALGKNNPVSEYQETKMQTEVSNNGACCSTNNNSADKNVAKQVDATPIISIKTSVSASVVCQQQVDLIPPKDNLIQTTKQVTADKPPNEYLINSSRGWKKVLLKKAQSSTVLDVLPKTSSESNILKRMAIHNTESSSVGNGVVIADISIGRLTDQFVSECQYRQSSTKQSVLIQPVNTSISIASSCDTITLSVASCVSNCTNQSSISYSSSLNSTTSATMLKTSNALSVVDNAEVCSLPARDITKNQITEPASSQSVRSSYVMQTLPQCIGLDNAGNINKTTSYSSSTHDFTSVLTKTTPDSRNSVMIDTNSTYPEQISKDAILEPEVSNTGICNSTTVITKTPPISTPLSSRSASSSQSFSCDTVMENVVSTRVPTFLPGTVTSRVWATSQDPRMKSKVQSTSKIDFTSDAVEEYDPYAECITATSNIPLSRHSLKAQEGANKDNIQLAKESISKTKNQINVPTQKPLKGILYKPTICSDEYSHNNSLSKSTEPTTSRNQLSSCAEQILPKHVGLDKDENNNNINPRNSPSYAVTAVLTEISQDSVTFDTISKHPKPLLESAVSVHTVSNTKVCNSTSVTTKTSNPETCTALSSQSALSIQSSPFDTVPENDDTTHLITSLPVTTTSRARETSQNPKRKFGLSSENFVVSDVRLPAYTSEMSGESFPTVQNTFDSDKEYDPYSATTPTILLSRHSLKAHECARNKNIQMTNTSIPKTHSGTDIPAQNSLKSIPYRPPTSSFETYLTSTAEVTSGKHLTINNRTSSIAEENIAADLSDNLIPLTKPNKANRIKPRRQYNKTAARKRQEPKEKPTRGRPPKRKVGRPRKGSNKRKRLPSLSSDDDIIEELSAATGQQFKKTNTFKNDESTSSADEGSDDDLVSFMDVVESDSRGFHAENLGHITGDAAEQYYLPRNISTDVDETSIKSESESDDEDQIPLSRLAGRRHNSDPYEEMDDHGGNVSDDIFKSQVTCSVGKIVCESRNENIFTKISREFDQEVKFLSESSGNDLTKVDPQTLVVEYSEQKFDVSNGNGMSQNITSPSKSSTDIKYAISDNGVPSYPEKADCVLPSLDPKQEDTNSNTAINCSSVSSVLHVSSPSFHVTTAQSVAMQHILPTPPTSLCDNGLPSYSEKTACVLPNLDSKTVEVNSNTTSVSSVLHVSSPSFQVASSQRVAMHHMLPTPPTSPTPDASVNISKNAADSMKDESTSETYDQTTDGEMKQDYAEAKTKVLSPNTVAHVGVIQKPHPVQHSHIQEDDQKKIAPVSQDNDNTTKSDAIDFKLTDSLKTVQPMHGSLENVIDATKNKDTAEQKNEDEESFRDINRLAFSNWCMPESDSSHGFLEVSLTVDCNRVYAVRRLPYVKTTTCNADPVYTHINHQAGKQPRASFKDGKSHVSGSGAGATYLRLRDLILLLKIHPETLFALVLRCGAKLYAPNEYANKLYSVVYDPACKMDDDLTKMTARHLRGARLQEFLCHMILLEKFLHHLLPRFYLSAFKIQTSEVPKFVNVKIFKPISDITERVIEMFQTPYKYNSTLCNRDERIKRSRMERHKFALLKKVPRKRKQSNDSEKNLKKKKPAVVEKNQTTNEPKSTVEVNHFPLHTQTENSYLVNPNQGLQTHFAFNNYQQFSRTPLNGRFLLPNYNTTVVNDRANHGQALFVPCVGNFSNNVTGTGSFPLAASAPQNALNINSVSSTSGPVANSGYISNTNNQVHVSRQTAMSSLWSPYRSLQAMKLVPAFSNAQTTSSMQKHNDRDPPPYYPYYNIRTVSSSAGLSSATPILPMNVSTPAFQNPNASTQYSAIYPPRENVIVSSFSGIGQQSPNINSATPISYCTATPSTLTSNLQSVSEGGNGITYQSFTDPSTSTSISKASVSEDIEEEFAITSVFSLRTDVPHYSDITDDSSDEDNSIEKTSSNMLTTTEFLKNASKGYVQDNFEKGETGLVQKLRSRNNLLKTGLSDAGDIFPELTTPLIATEKRPPGFLTSGKSSHEEGEPGFLSGVVGKLQSRIKKGKHEKGKRKKRKTRTKQKIQ